MCFSKKLNLKSKIKIKKMSRAFSPKKLAKFLYNTTDLRDRNGLKDHITKNIGISICAGELEDVYDYIQIEDIYPSDAPDIKSEVKNEPASETTEKVLLKVSSTQDHSNLFF